MSHFDANVTVVINTLIRKRRSIYQQQFSGERVPDVVVKQMLENANWAPNHRLTEPWRFIVYTGDGIRKLAEVQAAIYKSVTEADGTYKEERYQNLLTKPMSSSHIIAIAMKRDEKNSVPEVEEVGAVYCAIQNMYLTMTAYEVAGYLSTGGVTYFEESKEAFGLAPTDKLIGFFHLGMPKGNIPDSKRKPIEEKVIWVTA
jgi:nitroreductase